MADRLADVALDHQLDLLRWCQGDIGIRFMDSLFETSLPGVTKYEQNARGSWVAISTLVAGETYVVTNEILPVLDQAATLLPNDAKLHPNDLPTPVGFVWLEEPVVFEDVNGKNVVAQGFMWNQMRMGLMDEADERVLVEDANGVSIILLTCPDDPRDHMHEQWYLDVAANPNYKANWPTYMPMICGIWPLDDEIELTLDGTKDAIMSLYRWVAGFFFFINETWIDARMYAPSRPTQKRATRAKKLEPEVKIVRLRRAEQRVPKTEGTGTIEWSHRWVVRPHWRHQWYPSQNRHRYRFIPSYIKGPDDKPLIVHDKIFKVDR